MRAVAPQLQPEDEFAASREQFTQMEAFLMSDEAHSKTHSELERELEQQGRELLRRLYQAHLELRAPGEAAVAVRDSEGQVRQPSRRQKRGLETVFGEVRVERLGYGGEGLQSLHPLDADLNLPPELYSHQVRRRAAEEAAEGSFDKVVEALSKTTGAQVGKRQVQELVGRAAQDFDAFYQERQAGALAPSESGSILAISVDGKGVVLRGEDLREATRQRAEASEHKLQKRLSKGEKRHAKRMATVAAVYTIAPQVRRPEEVMRVLAPQPQREEGKRPRPQHKRLWASLEKRPEEVIEQALGEARSRDPTGRKSWVVLVDGHRSQLKTLLRCLRRSGVGAPTIVLDFIHVSEYVWKAGMALHGEVHPKLEGWVSEHLLSILRGRSGYVAGGIRRSATRRGLEGKAREAVDRCANYLLKNAGYLKYDTYLAKGFPSPVPATACHRCGAIIAGACRYPGQRSDGGLEGNEAVDRCANYLLKNAGYLKYDTYLAKGFPIATGVIEGACRYLVKDRMEVTGARWSLAGAEAVQASGDACVRCRPAETSTPIGTFTSGRSR